MWPTVGLARSRALLGAGVVVFTFILHCFRHHCGHKLCSVRALPASAFRLLRQRFSRGICVPFVAASGFRALDGVCLTLRRRLMLLPAMIWLGSQILGWPMVDMETVMQARGALAARRLRVFIDTLLNCWHTQRNLTHFCAEIQDTESMDFHEDAARVHRHGGKDTSVTTWPRFPSRF